MGARGIPKESEVVGVFWENEKIMGFMNYVNERSFSNFPQRYLFATTKVDKKPSPFGVLLAFAMYRFRVRYLRGLLANRHQSFMSHDATGAPNINLLYVVHPKDFYLLPTSLEFALKNSLNEIRGIFIITTAAGINFDFSQVRRISSSRGIPVSIFEEDEFVEPQLRIKLRNKFGNRYGWVLQQVITLSFVLSTYNFGTPCLQVNADTWILREQLWIDRNNRQVLMESHEFHKIYYDLLRDIGLELPRYVRTFIPHHMLFQSDLLKSILLRINLGSLELLIEKVLENVKPEEVSPVCIEYELYAQGLRRFFPHLIKLTKHSNLGVKFSEISSPGNLDEIQHQFKCYNSISVHSWLADAA